MYLLFLVSIILIITIKLLEKDSEQLGFGTIITTALLPTFVTIIIVGAIKLFELNELFSVIELGIFIAVGLSTAVGVLFYISKSVLEWKWGRSLILAIVYIASSVGVQFAHITVST